jgi:integrase
MAKRILTDKMLAALKPAKPGQRTEIWDADIHARGLGIRVTPAGTKTFILMRRYPSSKNPVRRELGKYGEITLAEAREKARGWIAMINQGIDPKVEVQRARIEKARAAERSRANSFGAVAADFIAEKLPGERQRRAVEGDIRREFLPRWADRPVCEIADEDIVLMVKDVKKRAPVMARNLLGTAHRLFAWAIDQRCYGLKSNPAAGLKANKLIGDKVVRDRVLSEDELIALWRSTRHSRHGYPFQPLFRLLLLTGLRLNEVARATWTEIDRKAGLWTIPAERMKGRNGRAKAHTVPLTHGINEVLDSLPRFRSGDFLFSSSFGRAPIWVSDKAKRRLDARMLLTLKALARVRGEDPAKVSLSFRSHDIRRTLRTGLAKLRVSRDVAEAVLGHTAGGVVSVYDVHNYADEKREALERWEARLRSIVKPTPDNVVSLQAVR